MAEGEEKDSAGCTDNQRLYVVDIVKEEKADVLYPACRSILDADQWSRFISLWRQSKPESFPKRIARDHDLPGFLPDLARLEWSRYEVSRIPIKEHVKKIRINPALRLLRLSWKNLASLLGDTAGPAAPPPEMGKEMIFVWRHPNHGDVLMQEAKSDDILVLKMVLEDIDSVKVATAGGLPVGVIDRVIDRAVERGILLSSPSRLSRDPGNFPLKRKGGETYLNTHVFTLQWHITQDCDLHCRHCYDRNLRPAFELDAGLAVLEDMRRFCRERRVRGQVTFTGGNPVLHPDFFSLYRAASEQGLAVAVLGNPVTREQLAGMVSICKPAYYQISLEGLENYNDRIREKGSFKRAMKFLRLLREMNIYSMVMLTLTKDNLDQVLPLADILRCRTDLFTFNRLSRVGEGVSLELPQPREYEDFLRAYLEAARDNPVLSLKDNLFNILLYRGGQELFGGCTGFGCGAAFNFVALLPDGEVHACRKFPSFIGNIRERSLADIYDSGEARRYREGTRGCRECDIRRVCGGCLASVFSRGGNLFEDRDPFCFMGNVTRGSMLPLQDNSREVHAGKFVFDGSRS